MISASVWGFMSLTLPGVNALTSRAGSTRRTVTGISATPPGSAKRSITPKGEAANLASGGIRPVAVFIGKLPGDASARPDASTNFVGNSMVKDVLSTNGGAKVTDSITASSSALSSSAFGFWVLSPPFIVICIASLRDTGALKRSSIGRSGRQAACAFSRSQVNDTANGSRTSKANRFSIALAMPDGVATPLP